MKLVCSQSDLSTHLSLTSRAVPKSPTHPVLANVLAIADAQTNRVSLTAFDLSLGIRTSFSALVLQAGAIALPAKLLNDIVSRLGEGEITLEKQSSTESEITLVHKSGRYQIRATLADEFPELPVIEDAQKTLLQADALIEGLRGSLFATSTDETKQVLTGVHLTIKQDGLEFAATDGHRLAVVETTNDSPEAQKKPSEWQREHKSNLEVTVPARALRELERMLAFSNSPSEPVSLYFDRGQAVFEWQNQRLTTRTLEGQYPAYQLLIPQQFQRELILERRQFLSALERIAVLADQKNNLVKLSIDSAAQQITLSVEAQDIGSAVESIPAQVSGEDLDIAFNIKYLMDGLKNIQSSEIQMQLNTNLTPVIFRPLGGLKMTYLAMPVQLRT